MREKTGNEYFSRKSTTERETRGSIKVVEMDPPPELVKIILIVLAEKKTTGKNSESKKSMKIGRETSLRMVLLGCSLDISLRNQFLSFRLLDFFYSF